MTDPYDREDRFGVPVQRIIDVMKAHRGLVRDGCYVPTRGEVATWPADRLWWHLFGWWHESPIELIPTDDRSSKSFVSAPTPTVQKSRKSSRKRRRQRTADEETRTRTGPRNERRGGKRLNRKR